MKNQTTKTMRMIRKICSDTKKIIAACLLLMISQMAYSQEYIMELPDNPILMDNNPNTEKSMANDIILSLPFFDDFSYDSKYPSQELWCDKEVYVNRDYAYSPISVGVATFDALDENGVLYSWMYPGTYGTADYLTSRPIRLDSIIGTDSRKLSPSDSVYLSFFFQPLKKYENEDSTMVNFNDSLCLEFFSADSANYGWHKVWGTPRFAFSSIDTAANKGQHFIEVILPIDEEMYFNKNFQFRFHNVATLPSSDQYPGWQSNAGRWNLDYVYIDYGRTMVDNYYRDVCFVSNAMSFLKDYYAMPNRQFAASNNIYEMMVDNISMAISNLDKTYNNVNYSFSVVNAKTGKQIWNYNSGIGNINPYYNPVSEIINGPKYYTPNIFPNVYPTSATDSSSFVITHVISETGLDFKENDTVRFRQDFFNYYAYDDGTPEFAYCLGEKTEAMVCERFKLNVADTLKAVKIYFTSLFGQTTNTYTLAVWNDLYSSPNDRVYQQNFEMYFDSINQSKYYRIVLDEPLVISTDNFPNLAFYVGLVKARQTPISLGFDISRNSSSVTFINVDGTWMKSAKEGTVMIRPYIGGDVPPEEEGIGDVSSDNKTLRLYPNPVSNGYVTADLQGAEYDNTLIIYDLCGNVCCRFDNVSSPYKMDVTGLEKGIYIVKSLSGNGTVSVAKMIIVK